MQTTFLIHTKQQNNDDHELPNIQPSIVWISILGFLHLVTITHHLYPFTFKHFHSLFLAILVAW